MYRYSLPVPTKPHLLRLHRSRPLLQKLPLLQRQFLGHHQKLRKFHLLSFLPLRTAQSFPALPSQIFPLSARPAPPFPPVPEGRPSPPPRMPAQKPCLPLRSAQVPSHNNFSSYFSLTFICTFFIPNANKFLFSSQTEKAPPLSGNARFFAAGCQLKGPVALRHRLSPTLPNYACFLRNLLFYAI